jgi:hypothetical protein
LALTITSCIYIYIFVSKIGILIYFIHLFRKCLETSKIAPSSPPPSSSTHFPHPHIVAISAQCGNACLI